MWYERRGNRGAAIGAAFCELTFFYYGIGVVKAQEQWLGERQIAKWWNDAWESLEVNLPGWQVTMEFLGRVWPYAWQAIVLPAAWLTLAIIVYGAYAEDVRTVLRGTRLESGAERAERALHRRTHALTRVGLIRFFGRWAHWVALAHTFRLTVRGGAPLFGMFAVCFVAIRVADGYVWRGLHYLLDGPHPLMWWEVLWVPIGLVRDMVVTLLTTCLLAATFDLAAIRGRVRAGGGSDASATTPPDAAAPVPRPTGTGAGGSRCRGRCRGPRAGTRPARRPPGPGPSPGRRRSGGDRGRGGGRRRGRDGQRSKRSARPEPGFPSSHSTGSTRSARCFGATAIMMNSAVCPGWISLTGPFSFSTCQTVPGLVVQLHGRRGVPVGRLLVSGVTSSLSSATCGPAGCPGAGSACARCSPAATGSAPPR